MLKLSVTPSLPVDWGRLAQLPNLGEALLGHRRLARLGPFDDDALAAAARAAKNRGLRVVLVWDVLAGDADIAEGGALLRRFDLALFDAVRVQDPGVARYVRDHYPDWPLQLILETGSHNLAGVRAWIRCLQPERVALSNELPLDWIRRHRGVLEAQVEVQALGRLLLFYTPRKLIGTAEDEPAETRRAIHRFITSAEDRKSFPLVENRHGSFMFYEKDLYLLPFLGEIAEAGVDFARLDLSPYDGARLLPPLNAYLGGDESAQPAVKDALSPKLTRGFFKSNRTDKQFAKLHNPRLRRRDAPSRLGSVLETRKRQYLALLTEKPFAVGDVLALNTPEGRDIRHLIAWIRTAAGERRTKADPPGLWLVNPAPGVSSGTQVFTADEQGDGRQLGPSPKKG